MKKIIIVCIMLATFVSCKKEEVGPAPIVPGSVTLTAVKGPAKMAIPGPGKFLGEVTTVVTNLSKPSIGPDISIGGTLPLSKLKNFYGVLWQGNDSILRLPTLSTVPLFYEYPWIPVVSGTYTIKWYAEIISGARGTVFITTQMQWFDDETDRSGSTSEETSWATNVSPYETEPIITWHSSQTTLQDSGYIDYEIWVENPGAAAIAMPQFTYLVNINDVDNNDTITNYKQEWLVNGEDSTSRVRVTKNGIPTTVFGEGINKMQIPYVTGNRYAHIGPGEIKKFILRLYFAGLHHDGNGVSIGLLTDDVQLSYDVYFLNQAAPGINLKLSTSQGASAAGITANLPWGIVKGSFSATPGSSSKSFTNGFGIPAPETQHYNQ